MLTKRERVVVAMSGGVDSSVAAKLLVEQGYDVMGLFMRVGAKEPELAAGDSCSPTPRAHQGCCSAGDAADARFVAGMLGIPFYALNFEAEFDRIIDYFVDEYARGRTPNPCVVCNDRLKFGKVVEYADAVGARYIATGHYARIGRHNDRSALHRAVDENKDQSYVLFGLSRSLLDRVIFPLGNLNKSEVRILAAKHGFPNHDKPDSVEICFVPDRNYARLVKERRPDAFIPGDVVNEGGRVVGRHEGVPQFTIGQRRGLGIAAGEPIYVTELNVGDHSVRVGRRETLLRRCLVADRVNFLVDLNGLVFRAEAKIRYQHPAAPATVRVLGEGRVRVEFDEPQSAIAPGQAVVFYDGDLVIGGAWILHSETGLEKEETRNQAERNDQPFNPRDVPNSDASPIAALSVQ